MKTLILAAKNWGWALAIGLALVALAVVYSRPDVPVVGQPPATTEEKIVAATGAEGFPVETFCKDPLTQVKPLENPPGVSGLTFQLVRLRDGVQEAVIWQSGEHGDNLGAIRYWFDENGVQQSANAVVTSRARDCIQEKAAR